MISGNRKFRLSLLFSSSSFPPELSPRLSPSRAGTAARRSRGREKGGSCCSFAAAAAGAPEEALQKSRPLFSSPLFFRPLLSSRSSRIRPLHLPELVPFNIRILLMCFVFFCCLLERKNDHETKKMKNQLSFFHSQEHSFLLFSLSLNSLEERGRS